MVDKTISTDSEHPEHASRTTLYHYDKEAGKDYVTCMYENKGLKHYKVIGQRDKIFKPKDLNTIANLLVMIKPKVTLMDNGAELTVIDIKHLYRKKAKWIIDDVYHDDNVIEIKSVTKVNGPKKRKNILGDYNESNANGVVTDYFTIIYEKAYKEVRKAWPDLELQKINELVADNMYNLAKEKRDNYYQTETSNDEDEPGKPQKKKEQPKINQYFK